MKDIDTMKLEMGGLTLVEEEVEIEVSGGVRDIIRRALRANVAMGGGKPQHERDLKEHALAELADYALEADVEQKLREAYFRNEVNRELGAQKRRCTNCLKDYRSQGFVSKDAISGAMLSFGEGLIIPLADANRRMLEEAYHEFQAARAREEHNSKGVQLDFEFALAASWQTFGETVRDADL